MPTATTAALRGQPRTRALSPSAHYRLSAAAPLDAPRAGKPASAAIPPTSQARLAARALMAVLWAIGSAILIQHEIAAPSPDPVAMAATPILWAAVIALPILAHAALADRQRLAAGLLTLAALVGAVYTFAGTLGRSADARDSRLAEAADTARRRVDLESKLASVELILAASRERHARECATGAGKACHGIETVIRLSEAAAAGHRVELAKLRTSTPDTGERRIAAALALATGRSEADMRATVGLVMPALLGLLIELAALACGLYGFARPRGERPSAHARAVADSSAGPSGADRSAGRSGDATVVKMRDGRKANVLSALLTDVALGRSADSQCELCHRYGVPRSTISDWLREWECAGLIPPRRTVGRRKALVAS